MRERANGRVGESANGRGVMEWRVSRRDARGYPEGMTGLIQGFNPWMPIQKATRAAQPLHLRKSAFICGWLFDFVSIRVPSRLLRKC